MFISGSERKVKHVLEQDIASIIKFTLDKAGNPAPYYWKVPKSFAVPSVYFPEPEIDTGSDTLSTYSLDYFWNVVFFHKTSGEAYRLALQVLTEIRARRNLIAVIDTDGSETEEILRVNDPKLKPLDNGAVQLEITWTSRRPYDTEVSEKAQSCNIQQWGKPELYESKVIDAAMEAALGKYIKEEEEQHGSKNRKTADSRNRS